MDSPPPTQVPLREPLPPMDTPRSLQPPGSPTIMGSGANNLHSPSSHNDPRDRVDNDRDDSLNLMGLSNGHGGPLSAHSLAHAQVAQAAAFAAQLHNQNMLAAAHAHSAAARHHMGNPVNHLMRKNLMPKPPYRSPPPMSSPGNPGDNSACSLIKYRDENVAAFNVGGRELICLPQAFDLFLKDLVGGLHTVYTKLKRLDIQPVVCNVEQVRILRGLGAIQPGVNRCKLISCSEFDVLYEDCTNSNARPGRPPKRNPSIHASPETIEKLKKSRMDTADFNYDPRYFGEPQARWQTPINNSWPQYEYMNSFDSTQPEHKSMMNGFPPHPYLPYLHMGAVNAAMMPQPVSAMALASAAQFNAMRSDPATNKDSKAFMEQELIHRQNQAGLASQLSMFGSQPLADHSMAARHTDMDPKPMNLSNGHARSSALNLPTMPPVHTASKGSSDDDDDEDDVMNDDKISEEDNDADLDDNSNDASDGYSGYNNANPDKQQVSGRQDVPDLMNGGQAASSQASTEVEKVLLNLLELTQKAFNLARSSQRQSGQDKAEMQQELMREKELRHQLEKQLEEEHKKQDQLERRYRKEKKARQRLQGQMERPKSGSPPSGHHGGNTAVGAPEMGLDLAIKPASSPEDPIRTQTTDAAESEGEGDKTNASISDGDRKLSESSERGCIRDPFDVFSAAAALSSSSAVAGGSPPVRFSAPYLSLISSEVQ